MPIPVVMPKMGESVEEATLTRWLKTAGERVEEFEPLLEVNTDKVDTEIPSPASGTLLEIRVPEGATVKVGDVLAVIEAAGEGGSGTNGAAGEARSAAPVAAPAAVSIAARVDAAQAPAPSTATHIPGRDPALGFISPVVAKIAREHAVDLSQVKGTGQGGRITKQDVLNYLAAPKAPTLSAATPVAPPQPSAPAPLPPAPLSPAPTALLEEILPLTPVRRQIAEHMVLSKHTSPHVTTVMEADLSRVVAHRQAHLEAFKRDGANLTYTAYFIAAAVAALKAYPLVNSSWSEQGIQVHRSINIGMATSLGEAGLIVPVIKEADGLSLLGLARAINDLAARARSKDLKPEEVRGGTFTITNHGITGSLFATPIINQPQCAILGVGMIQKRVVVISDPQSGDSIAIRPMVYISLTFDHRILDGASADIFLGKVVELLENSEW
jgi:2-oxoglutarate dehydrogenase dihydrolipoamide succinyltransferase (E2 component)